MFWLIACDTPDPDALLRAGRVSEALRAVAEAGGPVLDPGLPAVQALGARAAAEEWITTAVLLDFAVTEALLDAVPTVGTEALDLSVERWEPLAPCVAARLLPGWLVAAGRTAVPADPDPLLRGRPYENVPYRNGRIVGSAADRSALRALFASIDAHPPLRRLTLALSDARGLLAVNLERRDGAWWTLSANDAHAAAALLLACTGSTP